MYVSFCMYDTANFMHVFCFDGQQHLQNCILLAVCANEWTSFINKARLHRLQKVTSTVQNHMLSFPCKTRGNSFNFLQPICKFLTNIQKICITIFKFLTNYKLVLFLLQQNNLFSLHNLQTIDLCDMRKVLVCQLKIKEIFSPVKYCNMVSSKSRL